MSELASTHPPGVQRADEDAEDARLVARAQVDPTAFALLYDRYLGPVYRYCYRRLGSRQAAEDATSQIFYQALAALPSYRSGAFRAWLFTIAHHVVVDTVRRRRSVEPIEAAFDVPDGSPAPDEAVFAAERARHLQALLGHLPDDQRSVIELRLAGLKGTEIADVLGRSHGAVRMLQLRAVERLRGLIGTIDNRERDEGTTHGKA